MSPVPMAIREENRRGPVPVPPFPTADMSRVLAMEIVVDWQLSDQERKA